jgi:hypothetical protein
MPGIATNRGWHIRCYAVARAMTSNEESIHVLAERILRYLDAHPQAADTARGIHEWWVVKQVFSESLESVQIALDLLVERGLVERVDRPGTPSVYQRVRPDG